MLYFLAVVTVGFQNDTYTVSEGNGALDVCVTVSGMRERGILVSLATKTGTAEGLFVIVMCCNPYYDGYVM